MIRYWYYLKNVYRQLIFILISTIGFFGAIVTIEPSLQKIQNLPAFLFVLSLLVSIGIILILFPLFKYTTPFDPKDLWIFSARSELSILFPYEEKYLKPVNDIAKLYFSKNYTNLSFVKKWYIKNPFILSILADCDRRIIGYFDILPLKEDFALEFIIGSKKETDIKPEYILSKDEMHEAKYIYFAGIAVAQNCRQAIRLFGGPLLYAAIIYIETFYKFSSPKKIISIPVTDCGRKLLKEFGFTLETEKASRLDKLDLYSRTIYKCDIIKIKRQYRFTKEKIDLSSYSKYSD